MDETSRALAYFTPDALRRRPGSGVLSPEQQELNAGARLIYAARRWRAPRPARRHAGVPAPSTSRPLALLPPPPGCKA